MQIRLAQSSMRSIVRETVERCKERERNGGTKAMLARVEKMTKDALQSRAECEKQQKTRHKAYEVRLNNEVSPARCPLKPNLAPSHSFGVRPPCHAV